MSQTKNKNTTKKDIRIENKISALKERAKELNCLYSVEGLLNDPDRLLSNVFKGIIKVIPQGWQYPDLCVVRVVYQNEIFQSSNFQATSWQQSAQICVSDEVVGEISVYYLRNIPSLEQDPFLQEERRLLQTIAERLEAFIHYQSMRRAMHDWKSSAQAAPDEPREWKVILELLRRSDPNLLHKISRKMLIHLCWNGCKKAGALQKQLSGGDQYDEIFSFESENIPIRFKEMTDIPKLADEVFAIAYDQMDNKMIMALVQKWMEEDKSNFLIRAVSRSDASVVEIYDALRRYQRLAECGLELTPAVRKGVRIALIRRFLTDDLKFINIAKSFVTIDDFAELLHNTLSTAGSIGCLGGKTAGMAIAYSILKKNAEKYELLKNIKIPKTWFITADTLYKFVDYNNLEEIIEQKYKDIDIIRQEYPHIVQLFKSSRFMPEIIQGLSVALDDLGGNPLIVRSSSLLEDRSGSAFSGKYKSLFLGNQGRKIERLSALTDAIAEVYASVFSPDPIEYRAARGLLDFDEEMGIMIQQVVGHHIGHYYLPAYSGVAFSHNEFRWSPRIAREDGLIRLVPGLGTRAVDRLSDDYPILIAPGKPDLRANVSIDEVIRYAPKKIDVINLKNNQFGTIAIEAFLKEWHSEIPWLGDMISIVQDDRLITPSRTFIGYTCQGCVITFSGLLNNTNFIQRLHTMMKVLQSELDTPVDIEFAFDGTDFYLLQCRPQSYAEDAKPAPIPHDVNNDDVLFTANRYVSNGFFQGIKYIVYIDPFKYSQIDNLATLRDVGRTVGILNKALPKRKFILMGPGRWGSRGDIKLGVNVTYSDISNTAMLIEIARRQGNYIPDLSFGTHFFQDLVESNIRYLALYPDESGNVFNEPFFANMDNELAILTPEYAELTDVVRVIDIPKSAAGKQLNVLMNADLNIAIGLLAM
ncbi:MAG: pyruvate, phosphate dikinase [Calditrichaeota bacterium]|nr:pyruvate, phosphate dikinase [Calditrichota bacterium]